MRSWPWSHAQSASAVGRQWLSLGCATATAPELTAPMVPVKGLLLWGFFCASPYCKTLRWKSLQEWTLFWVA